MTPHPRFQHLIPGGDYIMGGDGLSDCDAHGTIVASMIGAAPGQRRGTATGGAAQAGHHSDHRAATESATAADRDVVTVAADRDDGSRGASPQTEAPPSPGPRRTTSAGSASRAGSPSQQPGARRVSRSGARPGTASGSRIVTQRRHGDDTQLPRWRAGGSRSINLRPLDPPSACTAATTAHRPARASGARRVQRHRPRCRHHLDPPVQPGLRPQRRLHRRRGSADRGEDHQHRDHGAGDRACRQHGGAR